MMAIFAPALNAKFAPLAGAVKTGTVFGGGLTVSVAGALVTVPAEVVTITEYAPTSVALVLGIASEEFVALFRFVPCNNH